MENEFNGMIQKELLDYEEILWMDQPNDKHVFTYSDILIIPFTVAFLIFALTWELLSFVSLVENKPFNMVNAMFPIIGIFFVAVGLYFVFGRFVYKNVRRKKTYYVVTNRRLIVVINLFTWKIKSIDLKDVKSIDKSENRKGNGTVYINNPSLISRFYQNSGLEALGSYNDRDAIVFINIKEVNQVYKLLNDIKTEQS